MELSSDSKIGNRKVISDVKDVKSIVQFIEFKGHELHICWKSLCDGTDAAPSALTCEKVCG